VHPECTEGLSGFFSHPLQLIDDLENMPKKYRAKNKLLSKVG
jgi:hypothetical protein